MRRSFLSLMRCFILCILISSCKQNNTSSAFVLPNPAAVDAVIDGFIDNEAYPFLYARLEDKNGAVIYEHAASNPTFMGEQKITGDSWIRIWSMSKIVTITVALDLIEEGLMNLDDPVTKFIPEFKDLQVAVSAKGKFLNEYAWGENEYACPLKLVPNDSIMTVLHLLNHEAGFYYATTEFSCLDSLLNIQNLAKAKDSQEAINRLAKLPLMQQPGSAYFYGTNTTVLGFVAERAAGKSLKALVKERITDPLKIEGLDYDIPAQEKLPPTFSGQDSILRFAKAGELDIFGADVPDYNLEHELYFGGEGMVATADGYADFLRMLLNRGTLHGHRFLEKTTVEDIYAPHTQLDNPYGYNGYNLWVSGDSIRIYGTGEAGLWIGGGYEGTHFWVDPKREFVGVIMTQQFAVPKRGHGKDDKIRAAIYEQLWAMEN